MQNFSKTIFSRLRRAVQDGTPTHRQARPSSERCACQMMRQSSKARGQRVSAAHLGMCLLAWSCSEKDLLSLHSFTVPGETWHVSTTHLIRSTERTQMLGSSPAFTPLVVFLGVLNFWRRGYLSGTLGAIYKDLPHRAVLIVNQPLTVFNAFSSTSCWRKNLKTLVKPAHSKRPEVTIIRNLSNLC